MSNENLLSSQTLADYYREYAAKNGFSTTTFSLNAKDCVILSPYIDQEKVVKAKEDLANSLYPNLKFKAAVVSVPLIILFEIND